MITKYLSLVLATVGGGGQPIGSVVACSYFNSSNNWAWPVLLQLVHMLFYPYCLNFSITVRVYTFRN